MGETVSRSVPVALHHTCFVVRDLEGTAQRLADALGIGPWNIWTIEPAECSVRGKPARVSFRIALATVGGGTYELITPHQGRSVYDDHLAERGEGFHHTCLFYASLADVRAAKAELRRQGREVVQEGGSGDFFEFGYYAFPEVGSVVELLYIDVGRLPAPEVVIQPRG
jgi:catechol 2,3-dioxygenase-like lactoylglutathione lyase family enzyme